MKLRLTSDAMRLVIPALSMTVLLAAVFWLLRLMRFHEYRFRPLLR